MKRWIVTSTLLVLLAVSAPAVGQWQFSGADIKNTNSGNVLIGNPTPRGKLTIEGGITLEDPTASSKTFLIGINRPNNFAFLSPWDWATSQWMNMAINSGGGVTGIGSYPDPNYTLKVGGVIRAASIVTDGGYYPDFVFAEDYELPTLAEVESFVTEHHHLPGMPSQAETEESGVDLGTLHRKLLQKIEELTLYTIQQQKEIAELRREAEEMRER